MKGGQIVLIRRGIQQFKSSQVQVLPIFLNIYISTYYILLGARCVSTSHFSSLNLMSLLSL